MIKLIIIFIHRIKMNNLTHYYLKIKMNNVTKYYNITLNYLHMINENDATILNEIIT